ncbi:MAG TPA: AAA family ATPase [Desulfuromonadaceae bacterium]|jgi:pilus assembly protein CpaE
MLPQASLVLIDSDSRARNDAMAILKPLQGHVNVLAAVPDLQEGMKVIQSGKPQIVILGVKEIEQGVKDTAFLLARFPQTSLFVTASDKNPDWILRLVRAGAGEYLTRPVVAQELVEAIQKVARLHAQRSGQNCEKGSAIAVYNPSAGMGTTTIAVNLAATLAKQGKQVAVVDLNLFSGDVGAFLDLTPRYTLSSITAKKGQIDASLLKSIVVQHDSGIHVLSAPRDLLEADRIAPELLQEVLAVLRTIFDYTIIDSGGPLFGCNLATFDCSDRVLFTTLLNLPALNNAKRYFMAMDREGLGTDRVKLVVSRHNPKDDIKVGDAEKILNTKIYQTVPNAYADASSSINKGVPLVSCYPRSPVTKAVEDLARQLIQEEKTTGKLA